MSIHQVAQVALGARRFTINYDTTTNEFVWAFSVSAAGVYQGGGNRGQACRALQQWQRENPCDISAGLERLRRFNPERVGAEGEKHVD